MGLSLLLLGGVLGTIYHFGFEALETESAGRAEGLVVADREHARERVHRLAQQLRSDALETVRRANLGPLLGQATTPAGLERVRNAIDQAAVPGQLVALCDAMGALVLRARDAGADFQLGSCAEAVKGAAETRALVYRGAVYQIATLQLVDAGRVVGAFALGRRLENALAEGFRSTGAVTVHGRIAASNLEARLRADLQLQVPDLAPGESKQLELGGQRFLASRWELPGAAGAHAVHVRALDDAFAQVETLRTRFLILVGVACGLFLIVGTFFFPSISRRATTLVARIRAAATAQDPVVDSRGLGAPLDAVATAVERALRERAGIAGIEREPPPVASPPISPRPPRGGGHPRDDRMAPESFPAGAATTVAHARQTAVRRAEPEGRTDAGRYRAGRLRVKDPSGPLAEHQRESEGSIVRAPAPRDGERSTGTDSVVVHAAAARAAAGTRRKP
jgi:hypothetical protein